jgi:hypothetical protein
MTITTQPYTIQKLTFFRRVIPTRSAKLNTFEVFPAEQHKLNIVRTSLETPTGTAHSVGFVFDGIAYHLESEIKFTPKQESAA